MPPTPAHARCLNCNYPLHSLPTNTCPECGQQFNPANPATMNLGRVPGPLARKLLTHTGWTTLLLALAATITLFITSGPPRFVSPQWADTLYLLDRQHWKEPSPGKLDTIYIIAVFLFLAVAAYVIFRTASRIIAQRRYALRNPPPSRRRFGQPLLLFSLLLSIAIILTAWPVRVCRLWIAVTTPPSWTSSNINANYYSLAAPAPCPFELSRADQVTALQIGATSSFRTHRGRIMALGLFVQQYPIDAVNAMEQTIAKETDPEFRALAIHVVSLTHQSQAASLFERLLNDPAPAVRAAAADAIDILRGPGLTQPSAFWTVAPPQIGVDPPLNVANLLPFAANSSPAAITTQTRAILEKMMTGGATSDEREAAARAIVNWPPAAYNLRVAEWGVWIADPAGNLQLVPSLIDEIPPFVHRIGNSCESLDDRYPRWMGIVTKPIVHIKVDRPLALDIEVYIRQGRLSFAYPKPDDLAPSDRYYPPKMPSSFPSERIDQVQLQRLHPSTLPAMSDLREGYPWLDPPHRYHNTNQRIVRDGGVQATSLGLRWQSLIVLPVQASWMSPPTIPADPKFKWWNDLRAVPSSYIASRNESERFLYYDGPTHAQPPATTTLKNSSLTFNLETVAAESTYQSPNELTPLHQPRSPTRDAREVFFIRVTAGQPTALRFTLPQGNGPITQELPATLPIPAANAIPQFKKLLTDYGLTPEESDGLIAAWRTQLFQTNGQRLLLRLSAADYDTLCPISIKPPPTTLVRLGFVLTEFPPQP